MSRTHVRTALAAKGLVEVKDGERARADQEQTLALATQEPPKDLDHAALRLAALERVFRVRRPPGGPIFVEDGAMESIDRTSQTGPTWAVAGTQTESTGAERALSTAVPSLEHTAHRNSPDADVDLRPRRRRGRPIEISDELKQKALAVKGGKARAQILYGIRYPTPQQVKNVSSILKHYLGKHKPNEV